MTSYLNNGRNRDIAQALPDHKDVSTTAFYDRRASKISLDDLERISFEQVGVDGAITSTKSSRK